jgi:ribosomal-protein-alanine acetyltransferase
VSAWRSAARSLTQPRARVQAMQSGGDRAACAALRPAGTATRLRAVSAPASPFPANRADAPVHIRRATADDHAELVELENAVFAIDRISARQLRRHLESLSAEVLVATRARRVIGAAVLFYRRAGGIARLYSIAVRADERGSGLGVALLAAAEQAARRRGSRRMRLEVRADNRAAQRLYERHGFHRFGVYRDFYEDRADALRYEKALGPARA